MNRRIILLLIIGIIILLGLGGLLFYFSKKQQQATQKSELGIHKVIDEQVISPVSAYNNNSIWYFSQNGKLFTANVDGSNLSEYPLPTLPAGTLKSALWPKTDSDFILISNDNNRTIKNYYDSTNKVFIKLPENTLWLDWMPDGKRIVYVWKTTDNKSQQLMMSNADGSGYKPIATLFYPDYAVKVDNEGKTALLYRTTLQGDVNKIYSADLATGQISTILNQGKNLGANWLPVGNKFLFAQATTASNPKIYLYDVNAKQVTDLNLSTSLDKTVVSGDGKTLYAAIPKSTSSDTFVKIDLNTLKQENYFEAPAGLQVKSMFMVGNTLYYIDGNDGKLYMISQ